MRKKGIGTAIILLGMVFCGCTTSGESEAAGSVEQEVQENKDSRQPGEETQAVEEEMPAEDNSLVVSLWGEDEYASTVLEDETALYFCGEDHIRKIEKESGTEQFIWESDDGREDNRKYVYSSAKGILVNDKIYFVENWETQEKQDDLTLNYALAVVNTDGTGYERIKKVQNGSADFLVLLDGILYFEQVRNSYSLEGYPVDMDGTLITGESVITEVKNIPEGYILPYYNQNGSRTLTPVESKKRFGYYLMRNEDYDLCMIDPETGKEEKLPEKLNGYVVEAVSDKFLLLVSYSEDSMYLYEHKTGAVRALLTFDDDIRIISMDDESLYLQRDVSGDDFLQHHYERIALKNGEVTDLFVTDEMTGINVDYPWNLMDISLLNGCLYYPGIQDYKLFLMRRHLEMPNAEEVLGSEFYDSKISEIGSVKTYKEKIYSEKKPEWVAATLDLEWLVIDDRFPGAANINRILEEAQQQNIAYEYDNAKWQDEFYAEEEMEYYTAFSLSSNLSPIYYWDGTYLSFVQQNYDYSGGAHGMPYWNGYVFNVQTGEQLGLVDIVSDDEIQIKGLVTQYFTEMYNEDPDMFWDGAVDTVFEYTTLDSQFYLSEEGIVFYFGPYDLAPYAGGFQEIVVPYSAWNLKIELEKIGV